MANLITALSVAGCRKSDGTANASGFVFLYLPGTTTLVPGYQDDALTQTWPTTGGGIQLDAGGRASIWVDRRVDVVVADASGAAISSMLGFNGTTANTVEVANSGYTGAVTDPATGAVSQAPGGLTDLDTVLTNLASSLGGVDGEFRIGASGDSASIQSVVTELRLSAKVDFGAVGDGLVDDTIALQKALSYAQIVGGDCVIYVGGGSFKTTAPLFLPNNLKGVRIEGAGPGATVILPSGAINAFSATGSTSLVLRNIQFQGQASLIDAVNPLLDRCEIVSTLTAYALSVTKSTAAKGLQVRNSIISGGTTSALLLASVTGGDFPTSIVASAVGSAGTAGVQVSGTTNAAVFSGCAITGGTGVQWIAGATGVGFNFRDCIGLGALTTPLDTSALSADPGIIQSGCGMENRTITLTGGSSITPSTLWAQNTYICQSGSNTFAVNPPTPTPGAAQVGKVLVLHFVNAYGGLVSWTMDAVYAITASIDNADTHKTSIGFYWDGTKWREMWRAVTT